VPSESVKKQELGTKSVVTSPNFKRDVVSGARVQIISTPLLSSYPSSNSHLTSVLLHVQFSVYYSPSESYGNVSMFSFSDLKKKRYTPVRPYLDEDQAEKALMSEGSSIASSSQEQLSSPATAASRWPYRLSLAANALLLGSIAVLSANSWSTRSATDDKFNNTLIKQVSMPSPVLDQVHVELSTIRRNGSLLPDHPTSIYRQDPSHEVDMAWYVLRCKKLL
jgi:hypothetical protein